MGLFDPHPDYPYAAPKELTVEGRALGFSLAAFGLHLGDWSITAGQIAAAGDEGALVVTANGTAAAPIRVPRGGMITAVEAATGATFRRAIFSLLYYEDGTAAGDPFADLRRFCEQLRSLIAKQNRDEQEKGKQRRRRLAGALVLALVVAVVGIANVAKRGASDRVAEPQKTDTASSHPCDNRASASTDGAGQRRSARDRWPANANQ